MSAGRVVIVGGGATGVILAARLLALPDRRVRVAIVERQAEIGAGIAYATDEPVHLLNTRAGSMSALPEHPDHFWRWLLDSGHAADLDCSDPFCFVPRRLYRHYLQDLVRPWMQETGDGRLQVVAGECRDMRETGGGVAVELADGRTEIAQIAVIATGHSVPVSSAGGPYANAWCSLDELGLAPSDDIVILGTGLSMIDNVTHLRRSGHIGRIVALSRRGMLPQVHRRSKPLKLDRADIPLGTDMSFLLAWLRRTVRWAVERDGDWRDVVDALRPHTQTLWQALPPEAKARFLRHARSFWEVHRHRVPPAINQAILAAQASGQLTIIAGRVRELIEESSRVRLEIGRRSGVSETIHADRVIDCTGLVKDPSASEGSLLACLIGKGAARVDPLRIGIETDGSCAIVDERGVASSRILAAGPTTRAHYWEITAIPDIRAQCAILAEVIDKRLQRSPA